MKNQTKVLDCLWRRNRKMELLEISEKTGLNYWQVIGAVRGLIQRGLIIKERTKRRAGYKIPPLGKIHVEVNKRVIKRIQTLLGIR